MITKQSIFILGFRKCGTTNLYDIVSSVPNYITPSIKEPQYFALPEQTVAGHLEWYTSIYESSEWLLDGSTLYVHDPSSLDRIDIYCEQPKYIVCLRDPAKRFYSAYWHMKVKGDHIESRSLSEVLEAYEAMETLSYASETDMLQACHQDGLIDLDYLSIDYHWRKFKAGFATELKDHKAFFRYWGESRYSYYLQEVDQDYLGITLEQLLAEPEIVIKAVEDHTGLSGLPVSLPSNRNKTVYRPKWAEPFRHLVGKKSKAYLKSKFAKSAPKIDEATYWRIRKLLMVEYDYWLEEAPELSKHWTWNK